jgi:ribosome-associated translation inhibitor RaiA
MGTSMTLPSTAQERLARKIPEVDDNVSTFNLATRRRMEDIENQVNFTFQRNPQNISAMKEAEEPMTAISTAVASFPIEIDKVKEQTSQSEREAPEMAVSSLQG